MKKRVVKWKKIIREANLSQTGTSIKYGLRLFLECGHQKIATRVHPVPEHVKCSECVQ